MTAFDAILLVGIIVVGALRLHGFRALRVVRSIVVEQSGVIRAMTSSLAQRVVELEHANEEITRLNGIIDDLRGEVVEPAVARQKLLDERVARLAALTEDERKTLLDSKCRHCGGIHERACPRVKRMVFGPNSIVPAEIEFFPDSEWSQADILWPEEIVAAAADKLYSERTGSQQREVLVIHG